MLCCYVYVLQFVSFIYCMYSLQSFTMAVPGTKPGALSSEAQTINIGHLCVLLFQSEQFHVLLVSSQFLLLNHIPSHVFCTSCRKYLATASGPLIPPVPSHLCPQCCFSNNCNSIKVPCIFVIFATEIFTFFKNLFQVLFLFEISSRINFWQAENICIPVLPLTIKQ